MIEIGKYNEMQVVKKVDFGLYLDGEEFDNILLPTRYMPDDCEIGDLLNVFIYLDSEDRLIATTEKPFAEVGQCAYLRVVDVNRIGAFLNWGLSRDLLVPFSEQNGRMQVGGFYVVYVYLDKSTNRIAASARLDNYLQETSPYFKAGQAVNLLISADSEMAYKAVINDTHLGLIYKNEVFQPLKRGQKVKGFIKSEREDGKIDLVLQLPGGETRDELMLHIIDHLKLQQGTSNLTDKSPPEEIYQQYSVSKANYKKALGRLYKQGLIKLGKDRITLTPPPGKM